jgi:alpha-L-rhamnosidase
MTSIPTDCPAREKAGWTGDILIYARTALLNEDVTPFLTSWLSNVRANQAANGCVMLTTPYTKLYHGLMLNTVKSFGDTEPTGIAGWSDAIVWVPYEMYQVTGNTLILKQNYDAMKKWCDYIIKTAKEKRGYHNIPEEFDQYLWNTGFHFGEWLIPSRPDDTGEQFGICKESSFYIAPFFGYQTMIRMSEICQVLGKTNEQKEYRSMAKKMKEAIRQGLFYPDMLPKHLMGAYVLAFAFDLVPSDLHDEYKKRLLDLIATHDGCLDTGFLATPFILDALCKLGEEKLAYQILWQSKQPSWLYEVDHGATAIWEAWDADEAKHNGRFVSFDHYAFGCVDDWICRHIAGIDSDTSGFSHLVIHPDMEEHLTSCQRTFTCEAGEISVSWTMEKLQVTIPCNTTATVVWKGTTTELGSGSYCL